MNYNSDSKEDVKDLVDYLWGYMPVEQVKQIQNDWPEAYEFACRIHAEIWHERMCSHCSEEATYVRMTQFAGNHHYCLEHAKEQGDFLSEEDYNVRWKQIEEE